MRKKIWAGLLLTLLMALVYFSKILYPLLPIGTGYAAKKMCSCHFIAGRTVESIQLDDLGKSPLNLTHTVIDEVQRTATTSLFGLATSTAVFKENLGCVLLQGIDDYQVELTLPETPKAEVGLLWPQGEHASNAKVEGVDYEGLEKAINGVFDPSMNMDLIKTRAVVVVYKDTLIAEKYANGFGRETEILGWSMTKSITNAMVGILVRAGKMKLSDDHLFEHWEDERNEISLKDLLQMQSGLAFEENYATLSDATEMLYKSEDIVERASKLPLKHPIGSHWSYSSGTSNILSGLIRQQFAKHEGYLAFPHEALFRKIGMHSAVMEIDESGNYIGSSYCYATPRDWAKFGLLYLNQGHWYGEQIIDSTWVDFSRQPAEHSKGYYGGHFWLNHNHSVFPDVPSDLYSCNGFEGQYVYIIPSKDLVVVRMGLNQGAEYDANAFLQGIVEAVE